MHRLVYFILDRRLPVGHRCSLRGIVAKGPCGVFVHDTPLKEQDMTGVVLAMPGGTCKLSSTPETLPTLRRSASFYSYYRASGKAL